VGKPAKHFSRARYITSSESRIQVNVIENESGEAVPGTFPDDELDERP